MMVSRSELRFSIEEWDLTFRNSIEQLEARESVPEVKSKFAAALIGVRRSGKTSLAMQMAKGYRSGEVLYYNFEDPVFYPSSELSDLDELLSVAEEFSKLPLKLLILAELQNVPGWERWARKIIDQEKYQLIITGSSASLLSRELATSIAGRALSYSVWPLSFREYLQFSGKQIADKERGLAQLRSYLEWGGFPEVVLEDDEETKKRILRQYLSDIALKDVISRYQIRSKRALDQIITFYATNLSSLYSYTAIKNAFGISVETVSDYTQALVDAFLFFEVSRYHHNLKVQSRDAKKVYCIDTGLRRVASASRQEDYGKLLENVVFIELMRRECEVYYYKGSQEVDFIVTQKYQPLVAIQVCASDMAEPGTYAREVAALEECLRELKLKQGTIVTLNREETIELKGGVTIACVPAVKWLLGDK
jgi:uncharacterized protein